MQDQYLDRIAAQLLDMPLAAKVLGNGEEAVKTIEGCRVKCSLVAEGDFRTRPMFSVAHRHFGTLPNVPPTAAVTLIGLTKRYTDLADAARAYTKQILPPAEGWPDELLSAFRELVAQVGQEARNE